MNYKLQLCEILELMLTSLWTYGNVIYSDEWTAYGSLNRVLLSTEIYSLDHL